MAPANLLTASLVAGLIVYIYAPYILHLTKRINYLYTLNVQLRQQLVTRNQGLEANESKSCLKFVYLSLWNSEHQGVALSQ